MILLRSLGENRLLQPVIGSPREEHHTRGDAKFSTSVHSLLVEVSLHALHLSAVHRPSATELVPSLAVSSEETNLSDEAFVSLVQRGELLRSVEPVPALRRVERLLVCLVQAFQDAGNDEVRAWLLSQIRVHRFLLALSLQYEWGSAEASGMFTPLLHGMLDFYRQYGVISVASLGVALAQHLRIQDLVPPTFRVHVRLGEMELATCPVSRFKETFLADAQRGPLDGLEAFTQSVLQALDVADALCETARTAVEFTEFLSTSHEIQLLYGAARTALGWILERRRNAKIDDAETDDLQKEYQITEEYRVEVLSMIESGAGMLLGEPIAHACWVLMKRQREGEAITRDHLRSALLDGCARNPVYPNAVVAAWKQVVDDLQLPTGGSEVVTLAPALQRAISDRFAGCFRDGATVALACAVGKQWSSAGYG